MRDPESVVWEQLGVNGAATVAFGVYRAKNGFGGMVRESAAWIGGIVYTGATKQFKVQSIADSGDGLSVDAFPTAAPVQIVTVKLTPKTAGKLAKSLTLLTELGPVTIQVEGDIKE